MQDALPPRLPPELWDRIIHFVFDLHQANMHADKCAILLYALVSSDWVSCCRGRSFGEIALRISEPASPASPPRQRNLRMLSLLQNPLCTISTHVQKVVLPSGGIVLVDPDDIQSDDEADSPSDPTRFNELMLCLPLFPNLTKLEIRSIQLHDVSAGASEQLFTSRLQSLVLDTCEFASVVHLTETIRGCTSLARLALEDCSYRTERSAPFAPFPVKRLDKLHLSSYHLGIGELLRWIAPEPGIFKVDGLVLETLRSRDMVEFNHFLRCAGSSVRFLALRFSSLYNEGMCFKGLL